MDGSEAAIAVEWTVFCIASLSNFELLHCVYLQAVFSELPRLLGCPRVFFLSFFHGFCRFRCRLFRLLYCFRLFVLEQRIQVAFDRLGSRLRA